MPLPATLRAFLARARTEWLPWGLLPLSSWLTFQYRWVLDDAFIYFRYAENLAQQGQLVFNLGEYVEGYTSPLWMLILGAARTLGLPFWPVVVVVSLACIPVFHALLVATNRALSPPSARAPGVYLPLALLGTNYAVLSHFGSGMETPLVQICATSFALLIVRPSSRFAQIAVAAAPLVRPELALPSLVGLLWCWWKRRRFPKLLGLLGAALSLGWLSFRVHYYNDFFPNTYYLKMSSNWGRGFPYLIDTIVQYHFHVWLIVLALGTAAVALRRRSEARLPERAVIWLGAALVAAHVTHVGGDFVHYRYLAFPVCALFASFGGVAEWLLSALRRWQKPVSVVATLLVAVLMATEYPQRQLPAHPLWLGRHDRGIGLALGSFSRDGIEDSMRHRSIDSLDPAHWDVPAGARPIPGSYSRLLHTGWCAAAYDLMDHYVVHSFGLTSAVLARLPVAERAQAGHKWDLLPYAAQLVALWADAEPVPVDSAFPVVLPIRVPPGRVGFRASVSSGRAPPWMRRNLRALELIEEKTYDANPFRRSVELAFTRVRLVL